MSFATAFKPNVPFFAQNSLEGNPELFDEDELVKARGMVITMAIEVENYIDGVAKGEVVIRVVYQSVFNPVAAKNR